MIGYTVIGFFAPPFFAVTIGQYVTGLGGPEIPWYWYALGLVALTTALAYRRIDLSAKVLTTVMVLEVITVVVFDIAAFITGGPADGGGATLAMPWITDNSIGLAILFVVGNFLGFEATVIYREEVKDPNKTIPRATYLAVAGIGLFYALAAWAFVSYFGADQVQGAATDDTAGMFTHAMTGLVGKTIVDVVSVLLLTSIIASALAIQNVSARYLFSLGTDRVLPAFLGKVHRRHRSPYISASLIGAIWAAGVVIFALLGASPDGLYAKASGSGTFAILVLMLAASVAVVVYFRKNRATGPNATWKTFVAPVIAALGFAGITVLAIANYSELIGDTGLVTTLLLVLTFAIPVVGVLVAQILRVKRPTCTSGSVASRSSHRPAITTTTRRLQPDGVEGHRSRNGGALHANSSFVPKPGSPLQRKDLALTGRSITSDSASPTSIRPSTSSIRPELRGHPWAGPYPDCGYIWPGDTSAENATVNLAVLRYRDTHNIEPLEYRNPCLDEQSEPVRPCEHGAAHLAIYVTTDPQP